MTKHYLTMTASWIDVCICGNASRHENCCGCYLEQGLSAPTAEALMRSRYTAYVLEREAYLLQTWHPSTRPVALNLKGMLQPGG